MIGAIVGDIAGSRFEFCNWKTKEFVLLAPEDDAEWGPPSSFTDDTVMTLAVAQALEAFFESTSFEDAIRNAISIGVDSDTIGAICGAVAEAFYGVPKEIRAKAMTFLPHSF